MPRSFCMLWKQSWWVHGCMSYIVLRLLAPISTCYCSAYAVRTFAVLALAHDHWRLGAVVSATVRLVQVPILQPFHSGNKNCIVVIDNAAIHSDTRVKEMFEATGAKLLYLP
jgi:hypothetical protein